MTSRGRTARSSNSGARSLAISQISPVDGLQYRELRLEFAGLDGVYDGRLDSSPIRGFDNVESKLTPKLVNVNRPT